MGKVTSFAVHFAVLPRAARIWQPYRGFALVGRWGPQTVRSGRKGHGKTRYFLSEGGSAPEREAGSAFGPANPIEEVAHRAA